MASKSEIDEVGAELEALFAEARSDAPGPGLSARVLADAAAVQHKSTETGSSAGAATPSGGWLSDLIATLGGWSAVSGITAAGVVGLGIGLYSPDTITGWIGEGTLPFTSSSYAVTPDIGALWTEAGDV